MRKRISFRYRGKYVDRPTPWYWTYVGSSGILIAVVALVILATGFSLAGVFFLLTGLIGVAYSYFNRTAR